MMIFKKALRICIGVQLLAICPGNAQTYTFKPAQISDVCDIRSDGGGISCLFRISEKKTQPTVFRKVFLDGNLLPIDSIDYSIPGIATLVANDANATFTTHVFYSKYQKNQLLHFLVTENSGKVHSSFTKSASDFDGFFLNRVKRVRGLGITFVENSSPDKIIMTPESQVGSGIYGKTAAFRIEDGSMEWILESPPMTQMITTEQKLIGISHQNATHYNTPPLYALQFFSKLDGKKIHSEQLYSGPGYREISVMTSNGQEVMIAGTQYVDRTGKNGHFYTSLFDLNGQRIFDRVDTAAGLSPTRMHMLGSAFDQEGNLFLIGEGWKNDYTAAAITTAASILAVMFIGGTPMVNGQPEHKITSLVMAKISPSDGRVHNFYTFPVGPWYQFSNLITDGTHVLLKNSSIVLLYDPNEPGKRPATFAFLETNARLILASLGPVVIKKHKGMITLQALQVQ